MAAPAVSVVVPVYNVAKYLSRCCKVLSNQTLREIEIIAVDDGSTDGSDKILDDYAACESRLKVIHQPNAGAGAARNAGLAVATGEYLFFFDPDDSASRHMLKGMYSRARKKNADIVIAGKTWVDAQTGRPVAKYGFPRDVWRLRQPFSGREVSDHVFTMAKSVPWDKLFRREFILRHNLRFQETHRCNDVYFVDMALALAERIALVPRAYYRYSIDRSDSLQANKDKSPLAFLAAYDRLERGLRDSGSFDVFRPCFSRVFLRTAVFNLHHLREPANVAACYSEVRRRLLRLREEYDMGKDRLLRKSFRRAYCAILENETEVAFQSKRNGGDGEMEDSDLPAGRKFSVRKWFFSRFPLPVREAVKFMRSRIGS